MFLEAMIEYLHYFRVNIVLCFVAILRNMNMNRFMIIRIELKDKTKYDKYRRHFSRSIFTKVRIFMESSSPIKLCSDFHLLT